MSKSIEKLHAKGQSIWLDFIGRRLITSGGLAALIEKGWITGITSNPSIFNKAISGSDDYEADLKELALAGVTEPYDAFVDVGGEDIRLGADALSGVFASTDAGDGFVSLEAPPSMANDFEATVAEAKRLFSIVGRPNVMIKVPGTPEGVSALEDLIAEGLNINQTLLFDVAVYEKTAEAYLRGLERRLDSGEPIDRIASVASFFVSRVDTAVDKQLPEDSPLRGKAAIANTCIAYRRFKEIFSGERWERLSAAGARVQRPLWASTSTKNPDYPETMYVDDLIANETVNTVPEATLDAFAARGDADGGIESSLEAADMVLSDLADAGIDLRAVTDQLLVEGLDAFASDFEKLLERIGDELDRFAPAPVRTIGTDGSLGPIGGAVDERLAKIDHDNVISRIWESDHTVWKPEPTEISNRLGWLSVGDDNLGAIGQLRSFAEEVASDGMKSAVLLGMGGSSLAPEVFATTYGTAPGALQLYVLDTTDPASILEVESAIDPERTLFVVASKSGTTLETLSHFAHFWSKISDGDHFVAITDAGSPLESLANEHKFRRVFENPPQIGGRYSALSYFGLVPAALIGADLEEILSHAHVMSRDCRNAAGFENPGAWLGAVMGEAALSGRDKVTLVLPEPIASLGFWIEQLIAESTGKEGKGLLPIEGEELGAPDVYGDDRLFVALGERKGLRDLEDAGHPVAQLDYTNSLQLGDEYFRWEFAVAVAGSIIGINPFDQPNVQEAKDATNAILTEAAKSGSLPSAPETLALDQALDSVKAGDYIAIQAYLTRSPQMTQQLNSARIKLRDRYKVATTVGYGPRFLHSTGQYHKGGPDTGVFLQIVGDDQVDVAIPGEAVTFGELKHAQALGDLESLQSHGRRVARVTLDQLSSL